MKICAPKEGCQKLCAYLFSERCETQKSGLKQKDMKTFPFTKKSKLEMYLNKDRRRLQHNLISREKNLIFVEGTFLQELDSLSFYQGVLLLPIIVLAF